MLKILKRPVISLLVGLLAGSLLSVLIGCGIATRDFIANPPQGEGFGFSFTLAAYTLIGPVVGIGAGLVTGIIKHRWLAVVLSMLIGFVIEYSPIRYQELGGALILAFIGATTSVIVWYVIRRVPRIENG